jgi:hypothetical protein
LVGVLSVVLVGTLILAINFAPVPNKGVLTFGLAAIPVAASSGSVVLASRRHVPYADWLVEDWRRSQLGVPLLLTRKGGPLGLKDQPIEVIHSQPVTRSLAVSWYERGEP